MNSPLIGMQIEIVKYQPELKDEIANLQTHLWGPDRALNKAYFEWKYECNPYIRNPLIYLALKGGRAVGMRGILGTQWQIGPGDTTFIGLYPDDLVIAPDYRNAGLIPRIMKAAFDDLATRGYEYAFNLSSGPITFLASLAMGWRSIGSMEPVTLNSKPRIRIPDMRKIVSGLPLIRRFADRMPSLHFIKKPTFFWLDEGQTRQGQSENSRLFISTTPDPPAMAELVERLSYDGRLRHIRDKEYFSWRFKNPSRDYRFIFWKEDFLKGYIVLQGYFPDNQRRGKVNIVDWEATSTPVLKELLGTAIRQGKFEELFSWTATLSAEKKAILAEAGFKPMQPTEGSRYSNCVIMRPVRNELSPEKWMISDRHLLDLSNWDLRMLYSMHG